MLTAWSEALAENMKNCPASGKWQPRTRQRNGKRSSVMLYVGRWLKKTDRFDIKFFIYLQHPPTLTIKRALKSINFPFNQIKTNNCACDIEEGSALLCILHLDSALLSVLLLLKATISSLIYSTAGNVRAAAEASRGGVSSSLLQMTV